MQLYAILRRNGWRTGDDLQEAAARSTACGDEMSDDIRWIRSYVLGERDGSVGTVCIYEASSPEAIREHAHRAALPVDEIVAVGDTVIVRPDPLASTVAQGDESQKGDNMAKFMDVHSGFVGVTARQLEEAHGRDLAIEAEEGVHFERAWLDPESGKVFCLSNGPSREAIMRIHERAGHPVSEVYSLSVEVA